jgi:hypothetical protein
MFTFVDELLLNRFVDAYSVELVVLLLKLFNELPELFFTIELEA